MFHIRVLFIPASITQGSRNNTTIKVAICKKGYDWLSSLIEYFSGLAQNTIRTFNGSQQWYVSNIVSPSNWNETKRADSFFFFRVFITTAVWKKRMICEFGSLTFDKLATVVFKCRIKYDLQRVISHCHCIFNNYVNKARFYARSSVDRFQLFWQNVHWTGFRSMHDFGFKQKISDTKRLRYRNWNKNCCKMMETKRIIAGSIVVQCLKFCFTIHNKKRQTHILCRLTKFSRIAQFKVIYN